MSTRWFTFIALWALAGCDGDAAGPDGGVDAGRDDAAVASDATVDGGANDATTSLDGGPGPTIAWSACGGGFECGVLTVPLSYAEPSLGTLDVSVTRRRALSESDRIGPLLVLAGGPGQSGIELARGVVQSWSPVRGELRRFDVLGMDVRGTGATGPIVRCVDDARRAMIDEELAAAAGDEAVDAILADIIDDCASAVGPDVLAHLDSASAARDIDRLREALGEPALSLHGGSYGTWVAAAYASRFPARVRAAVLVSSLNGTADTFEIERWQMMGSDLALRAFFSWCEGEATCAFRPASGTTEDAFLALVAALEATPLTDSAAGRTRTLSPAALAGAVIGMLYDPRYPAIAGALAAARDGTPGPLLDVADAFQATGAAWGDSPRVILALDRAPPPGTTLETWRTYRAETIAIEAPIFARMLPDRLAIDVRLRLLWPYVPDDPITPPSAPAAPPFLVIGGVADPATPIAGARTMVEALGNASVLVETDHPGHFADVGACVHTRQLAYVLDPSAAIDATRCPWPPPAVAPDETVVAVATEVFSRDVSALRLGETALGDLVADAMLAAGAADGVEIAMINSGGIQNAIPSDWVPAAPGLRRPPGAGPFDVVVEDTRRVLRFGNRLAIVDVTGAELRAFLEHSVSGWTATATGPNVGRFVQLAGARVSFSGSAAPGARIVSIALADGTPIDDTATYRIAVPDFVLYGGTGTGVLAERAPAIGAPLEEVLADHLRVRGTLTPSTDGRIAVLP